RGPLLRHRPLRPRDPRRGDRHGHRQVPERHPDANGSRPITPIERRQIMPVVEMRRARDLAADALFDGLSVKTAPAAAQPLLVKAREIFGFVPNLAIAMAE